MQRLQQKIIFITGASSGIGKSCAEQFAAAGAKVILAARRLERIEALAAELTQQHGVETLAVPLDIQDQAAVQNTIEGLPAEWAEIDVLVNNAGCSITSDLFQEGQPENWNTMIDTNVKGLLYVTRAIVPMMLARKKGHIVNISSTAGNDHYRTGNVYSASKHMVRALSRSMHIDLLGENIRVSDVAPGLVETEFSQVRWQDKKRAADFYEGLQVLAPEDIADAVIYCASRPEHVDVSEMVVMPTIQASPNHVHRPQHAGKGLFD